MTVRDKIEQILKTIAAEKLSNFERGQISGLKLALSLINLDNVPALDKNKIDIILQFGKAFAATYPHLSWEDCVRAMASEHGLKAYNLSNEDYKVVIQEFVRIQREVKRQGFIDRMTNYIYYNWNELSRDGIEDNIGCLLSYDPTLYMLDENRFMAYFLEANKEDYLYWL